MKEWGGGRRTRRGNKPQPPSQFCRAKQKGPGTKASQGGRRGWFRAERWPPPQESTQRDAAVCDPHPGWSATSPGDMQARKVGTGVGSEALSGTSRALGLGLASS